MFLHTHVLLCTLLNIDWGLLKIEDSLLSFLLQCPTNLSHFCLPKLSVPSSQFISASFYLSSSAWKPPQCCKLGWWYDSLCCLFSRITVLCCKLLYCVCVCVCTCTHLHLSVWFYICLSVILDDKQIQSLLLQLSQE